MYTLYNRECKIPVKNTEENKLKLLVVEDEKKLCEMIAKSLHRAVVLSKAIKLCMECVGIG